MGEQTLELESTKPFSKSLTGGFGTPNKRDIRTLFLASLGGMLECYDFMIFAFFSGTLALVFFPASDPFWATINTYGTFVAGYFARPLGGVVMAHYGDKYGRKKIFFVSLSLMVLPTFALALMPTYDSIGYVAAILLLSLRILQGIAMGGEYPGAFVFVYEHTPKEHRAFGIGVISAAMLFGLLLGAIITLFIYSHFTQQEVVEFVWRAPFILGGIFGIFAIFLRRYLDETPIFKEIQARRELQNVPLKKILTSHNKQVFYSILATWVGAVYTIVFLILAPNFAQEVLGISKTLATYMQICGIFGMAIGLVSAGLLGDKYGISRIMPVFASFSMLLLFVFFINFYGFVGSGGTLEFIWALYIVASLFLGFGTFVGLTILKSFGADIRLSGFSTSYNLSYAIFGGITIYIVPIFHAKYPLGIVMYLFVVGLVSLALSYYVAKVGFKDE